VQLTSPEPAGGAVKGRGKKSTSSDLVMEAFAQASNQSRKASRRAQARREARRAPADRTGAIGTRPKAAEPAGQDQGAGKTANLAFTVEGNRVSFKVPLEAYEMVVISTKPR
jgi:hypothetical protein